MEKLIIGKLAELTGVGVETVRFYQRKELLREPKAEGAFRIYSVDDAQRIIFIKKSQELNTKSRITCGTIKSKTLIKLQEIDQKISDLQKMKLSLEKLACACDASQDQIRQFKVQECFSLGQSCKY
jgi:MerR family mercuric resistance operon transcriptional regulator